MSHYNNSKDNNQNFKTTSICLMFTLQECILSDNQVVTMTVMTMMLMRVSIHGIN